RRMVAPSRSVAATEGERSHMHDPHGPNPRKIVVVPGGVNLETFQPGTKAVARQQLGLGPEPPLLFVGRIQRLKGIDVLIRSAAALSDELRGIRVVVAGGSNDGTGAGPAEETQELQRLRALVDELELSSSVQFIGAVEQP